MMVSIKGQFTLSDPSWSQLPSMYDLPSESPEDPGLPDEFHDLQPQLLSWALALQDYEPTQWFTGTDLNVYYDLEHPLWYKRPDWFLALNVPYLYDGRDLRLSYVIWQENQSPSIVVELLSPNTETEDLGRFYRGRTQGRTKAVKPTQSVQTPSKLEVYEHYLKVPHYVIYSRYTQTLRYLKRIDDQYQEQPLRPQNPLIWFEELAIGLGLWEGRFGKIQHTWLRWCDQEGNWLLTPEEREKQARQQAELDRQQAELDRQQEAQARQQAELAKQQAERDTQQAQQQVQRLAERLRELGIDPNEV